MLARVGALRAAVGQTNPTVGCRTKRGSGTSQAREGPHKPFWGKANIDTFSPARKSGSAPTGINLARVSTPGAATPALAVAREHLRGDEERLEERPRREAARERAEERGRAGRVAEPPDVLHHREPVDVDVVRRGHFEQPQTAVRAPQTALLDAAPRRLRDAVRVEHFVDHDGARLDAARDAPAAAEVARPDARRQPELAVVGEPDGLLLVAEGHKGEDGAEGLLAHHGHRVVNAREHGRLVEPAAV